MYVNVLDFSPNFPSHIEKYLSMYHRNAGYEISRTYRYKSSNKVEACLISTKQWNKGDQMHFCAGALTALTPEEEDQLQDFSMIYSTKKKSTNLFLGPARFANHDCKPNVHVSPKRHRGEEKHLTELPHRHHSSFKY